MKATHLQSIAYTSDTKPYKWSPIKQTGFGHFKIEKAEPKWNRTGEGFGVELILTCNGLTYAQFFPSGTLEALQPFGVQPPASLAAGSYAWRSLAGKEAWGILARGRRGVRFVAFTQEEPKISQSR